MSYRDLDVWKKAIVLVTEVYRFSKLFPKDETYGLSQQMRRSAVSIPSNIAEGYGRCSTSDYIRFLQIAVGSLYEFQTQIVIARNLEYLSDASHKSLDAASREIERMLTSLTRKLQEHQNNT